MIYSVFREMAIGEFRIRISNRKVLKGLLQEFGVADEKAAAVLRALDKVEKEEPARIREDLEREGMKREGAARLFELISKRQGTDETLAALGKFDNDAARQGLEELRNIVHAIRQFGVPDPAFAIDLGVVRGLEYYTGTIYETTLTDHPEVGSICSGGRYDDLASYFTETKLPGVGISIGLTRLFAKLVEAKLLRPLARTPAEVLVTTMDPRSLDKYLKMARELRDTGINTEVYLESAKIDKQLAYANKKGFRVALIAGESEFAGNMVQVKDLATREARTVPADQVVSAVKNSLARKDS